MKADGGKWKAEGNASINREPMARRRGMTLFELLLVLVLLVVVGSLAAPLFEGSFASIRLRRGTDQVLAAWSQARTQAIEAGQIYQFRFSPTAGNYRVEPWLNGLEVDASEREELTRNSEYNTTAENELASWTLEETLPEAIVFDAAESINKDELGESSITQLDQSSLSEWSVPILFYPDGTTSSASLLLTNGKQLYRRATLRSLTGVARASDLLTRDEVARLKAR